MYLVPILENFHRHLVPMVIRKNVIHCEFHKEFAFSKTLSRITPIKIEASDHTSHIHYTLIILSL